jgi:hypothetical protein
MDGDAGVGGSSPSQFGGRGLGNSAGWARGEESYPTWLGWPHDWGMGRKLTDEGWRALAGRWRAGEKRTELAREAGVHPRSIANAERRLRAADAAAAAGGADGAGPTHTDGAGTGGPS